MNFTFTALDWAFVVAYLIGSLWIGWRMSRRVDDAQDFYLGDKSTPWWAIGLSVAATYVGATSFLGGPAWGYDAGLAASLIHINYPIAIVIVISVFLPIFYALGSASIYDYLERRFGRSVRTLMSGVFLFSNVFYSALMLYTVALVFSLITGWDIRWIIVLVAVFATTYTVMGGIGAVIWTDVLQTGFLLAGIIIAYVLVIGAADGETLSNLKAAGKTDAFATTLDPAVVETIWTGIFAMSIYHVTVYGVNQMMIQRTLAAKSLADAKKSYILMGYLAFPVFFAFFFLGILLFDHYGGREFADSNQIILGFLNEFRVPGMMGFIAVAVIAAAMSSLDSSLNSMATVSTVDFYQVFARTDASPEHYLKASRAFTVIWAVVIILPAFLFIGSENSLVEILSKIGSFFVGARLSTYMLGFFSRRANEAGVMVGILAGFAALVGVEVGMDVAWPWYCLIGGGVSIAIGWLASIVVGRSAPDWHPMSVPGWRARYKGPERDGKWSLLPGVVDKASWVLLGYFGLCLLALWMLNALIPLA